MPTTLYPLPQVIKDAAKHGELVVFVGAGASKLCGSPDWGGFANQVVDVLKQEGCLSFLEAEQLGAMGDKRRTLSIALAIADENKLPIEAHFDSILHPGPAKPEGRALYEMLTALRPVFVTTNYDKWLDEEGPETATDALPPEGADETGRPSPRPKYYRREHLTSDKLAERGAVIHLHGSYSERKSMVVSLKDYIGHYADARVQTFLADMFRNYTVLFVGYGLAELEILDHIIRSNEAVLDGSKREPRQFLLYAHRSSEQAQTTFIRRFFNEQCGVEVIPYCIDAKGYGELGNVFRTWAPELDVRDPTLLDRQAQLDRCVAGGAPTQRDAAIRAVLKNPELTAYFINSLKDPIWFRDLADAGFFDRRHSPAVKELQGEQGTMFQADGWPALRYLEHIAPLADSNTAAEIIEIVRSISADSAKRKIDNWRTWWSLATIMSRLPLEVIQESDVQMARMWLLSRFEANMVGHELGGTLLPRLLDSPDPTNWPKALALVDALSTPRSEGGE
jgi:hypothetical protein